MYTAFTPSFIAKPSTPREITQDGVLYREACRSDNPSTREVGFVFLGIILWAFMVFYYGFYKVKPYLALCILFFPLILIPLLMIIFG